MPDIREKPSNIREKNSAPKGRTSTKAVRTVGRQLTEKYRKELAQPDKDKHEESTATETAVDRVEAVTGETLTRFAHVAKWAAGKAKKISAAEKASQSAMTADHLRTDTGRMELSPQEQMRRSAISQHRKKIQQEKKEKLDELRISSANAAPEPVEPSRPASVFPVQEENIYSSHAPSIHPSNPSLPARKVGEHPLIRQKIRDSGTPQIKLHTENTVIKTRQIAEKQSLTLPTARITQPANQRTAKTCLLYTSPSPRD